MGMTSVMASSPEQLVVAFQHDYKIWNDESFQNRQPDNDGNAMRIAEQNYHALLKKYTKPDFRGEPIAYGSESSHDPLREKMTAQKIEDSRAIITTQVSGEYYSPVYEYHFVKENRKWYMTQLFLVDEDGKYPSL
jgi:hypothetical protein